MRCNRTGVGSITVRSEGLHGEGHYRHLNRSKKPRHLLPDEQFGEKVNLKTGKVYFLT